MYFDSMGNVTECNHSYIHLNDGGKQSSIKATEERLRDILDKCSVDMPFYERMKKELLEEYERRRDLAEEKYHFITDDDVKSAYEESRDRGFWLELGKESHNAECTRQFAYVHGLYDGVKYAQDRYWEAYKLGVQAKRALKIK